MFNRKNLKSLIIPLIIEQTLALTVGMVDTIMVASVGESAVSGVSLVDTINILLINLFVAIATGGAIVSAQYLGRKEKENSNRAAKQLVVITFFLSILIMSACLAFNRQILSLIFKNVDADVMNSASIYFYITALSYPFIALFNSSAALFRGMGNSKIAMLNAIIMNVLNVTGNAVFIYGLKQGVFGAALATLISRVVAAITMLWMLKNPRFDIYVKSYIPNDIDFGMIKRIMRIGIPNGLENSIFQIGKIIMASLIAVFGTASIAANAVAASISGIEIIPAQAMGLAIMTIVAQCSGSKKFGLAKAYVKYLIKLAYLYTIILNAAILILLKPILYLYSLSPETYRIAFQLMLIHSICSMLLWPTSFTLPHALRASGDVKFPMTISIFSMWTFRIGFAYLFGYLLNLGVVGVWIAMVIDWSFRSICFVIRWKKNRWQTKNVI